MDDHRFPPPTLFPTKDRKILYEISFVGILLYLLWEMPGFFRTPYTLYFAAPNGRKVNFAPKNVQTFHFPQKLLLKMWPKSI